MHFKYLWVCICTYVHVQMHEYKFNTMVRNVQCFWEQFLAPNTWHTITNGSILSPVQYMQGIFLGVFRSGSVKQKNPWNEITTRDFVVRQNVSLWLLDEKVFNICSSKANVHVLVSKRALGENTVLLFRYFKDCPTEKTLHFPTLSEVRTTTHGKHTHFRLNKNKLTSSAFFWAREGFYTGQWSSRHRLISNGLGTAVTTVCGGGKRAITDK